MTRRIERTHTIEIDGSLRAVFPLFTPKGEEAWAEGWKPDSVSPVDRLRPP